MNLHKCFIKHNSASAHLSHYRQLSLYATYVMKRSTASHPKLDAVRTALKSSIFCFLACLSLHAFRVNKPKLSLFWKEQWKLFKSKQVCFTITIGEFDVIEVESWWLFSCPWVIMSLSCSLRCPTKTKEEAMWIASSTIRKLVFCNQVYKHKQVKIKWKHPCRGTIMLWKCDTGLNAFFANGSFDLAVIVWYWLPLIIKLNEQ